MTTWVTIHEGGRVISVPENQVKKQQVEPGGPAIHIFQEGYWEHIAEEPIYIKSKKQLREETRSRGLTSDYAE